MISRAAVIRLGFLAIMGLIAGAGFGCGSTAPPQQGVEVFQNAALSEVGGLIESYSVDAKKPPKSIAEVARYEIGMPTGFTELKSGNIVVFWGAPLSETATDAVLAYEKAVPQSGGFVLMQDGKTIKKMTADEFKAATKAPGKTN